MLAHIHLRHLPLPAAIDFGGGTGKSTVWKVAPGTWLSICEDTNILISTDGVLTIIPQQINGQTNLT